MKRLIGGLAGLLLTLAALASMGAFAGAATTADSARRFLARLTTSTGSCTGTRPPTRRSSNGDPSPWLSITAEKDPASIFGGFGGLGEAGDRGGAAARPPRGRAFRPSGAEVDFEYLVEDVRGKLASRSRSSVPTSSMPGRPSDGSRSCGPR